MLRSRFGLDWLTFGALFLLAMIGGGLKNLSRKTQA